MTYGLESGFRKLEAGSCNLEVKQANHKFAPMKRVNEISAIGLTSTMHEHCRCQAITCIVYAIFNPTIWVAHIDLMHVYFVNKMFSINLKLNTPKREIEILWISRSVFVLQ